MLNKNNPDLILAQHKTFETERLIIRKIRLNDAEDFYQYHSDLKVAELAGFRLTHSLEEAQNFIVNFNFKNPLNNWCLELKSNHQIIGDIGLNLEGKASLVEFFYALNQDFWGQGLMPEAAGTLRDFCFNELATEVIYATQNVQNFQSKRLLEKLGFQPLGQIYTYSKGKPQLSNYHALTRSNFHCQNQNHQ